VLRLECIGPQEVRRVQGVLLTTSHLLCTSAVGMLRTLPAAIFPIGTNPANWSEAQKVAPQHVCWNLTTSGPILTRGPDGTTEQPGWTLTMSPQLPPHTWMAPADLEMRMHAIYDQVCLLYTINYIFGFSFDNLAAATNALRGEAMISRDFIDEMERVNSAANEAKHKALCSPLARDPRPKSPSRSSSSGHSPDRGTSPVTTVRRAAAARAPGPDLSPPLPEHIPAPDSSPPQTPTPVIPPQNYQANALPRTLESLAATPTCACAHCVGLIHKWGALLARASFKAVHPGELTLEVGDVVMVKADPDGASSKGLNRWVWGKNFRTQELGWFPLSHSTADVRNDASLALRA